MLRVDGILEVDVVGRDGKHHPAQVRLVEVNSDGSAKLSQFKLEW